MVRLNVEHLESREVPAADVVSGTANVVQTAPVVIDFTPPIGSNKGSLVAGIAGTPQARGGFNAPYTYPDHWATVPSSFSGDAYVNEMGLVATTPEANGIIAILIGLRAPTQPANGLLLNHGDFATAQSNVTGFQGGCSRCDDMVRLAQTAPDIEEDSLHKQLTPTLQTSAFHILPYIEQDNVFKQYRA